MKEGYVLKADAAKHLTPEPITYEAMKRKSEKAAQTALKDAKASILNAAGIGKVEAYCINTVLAELKRKGLSPEQEEYKRISRETASSAATASILRPARPRKSKNAIASEHSGNISVRTCPVLVSSRVAAIYTAPMAAASTAVSQVEKRGPSSTRHKNAAHRAMAQALKNRSAT